MTESELLACKSAAHAGLLAYLFALHMSSERGRTLKVADEILGRLTWPPGQPGSDDPGRAAANDEMRSILAAAEDWAAHLLERGR